MDAPTPLRTMSFFSREELLDGGLPARRASLLLYAIENRTAHCVEQGVRDAAVYLTIAGAQTREHDFLAALAHGRTSAPSVSIQQIERYARQWQSLLPTALDPGLNAALAQLLGAKYKFTSQIPNIKAVLQLDSPAVQDAFRRAYNRPLSSIYAPQLDAPNRLRLAWARAAARLENLPPFWLAFFLTMPGAAGLLAMPIALAGVGLGGGLVLLIGFALLNVFTVSALAEATARSGITRFGLGWLGQLVQEYLGGAGTVWLTIILAFNSFFVLIIFYLGVGGTLQDATHVPGVVWMVVLFGVCVFILSRGSLNATIASTLVIVFVVLALLFVIPALALPQWRAANLFAAPLFVFDLGALAVALGLLLSTYFSHLLVATYGSVILRRDASARSWMRGCAAAILGFMLIACAWLIVVSGTIPPDELARTQGTVLTPLAERAGTVILWLGSLLVILSLGLAAVQIALALFYMVQERLPAARTASAWSNPRLRFAVSVVPLVGVLVGAVWLMLTGTASFSSFLGILSAITLPLLGGVFPVLLLAATRRRGDFVPGSVWRLLGNPVLLGLVYCLFVGILFSYALVIFQEPFPRGLVLCAALVTVIVTGLILRGGAFRPRTVIQVEDDARDNKGANCSVVANGMSLRAPVHLRFRDGSHSAAQTVAEWKPFNRVRTLSVYVPAGIARDIKIWTRRQSPEGGLQGISAKVEIAHGAGVQEVELTPARGEATAALDGKALRVQISFQEQGSS